MAVKHLNYRDLPPALRKKGAAEARQRVTAMMGNPFLPKEQREYFMQLLAQINSWESGNMPPPPKSHSVDLTETMAVAVK